MAINSGDIDKVYCINVLPYGLTNKLQYRILMENKLR